MNIASRTQWIAVLALLAATAGAACNTSSPQPATQAPAPAPSDETRDITAEAYVYAYAMLENYKTMYQQAVDASFPGYVGGFNRFRHYSQPFTPDDRDIVTPNNDTPYSWAWLDLRAEPIVLSIPAAPEPRYAVNQWFDLFTHNFAYTGVRATGRQAGDYVFAGPDWKGTVPSGLRVFRSETQFIGTLTRTGLSGPADTRAVQAFQAKYKLTPLSTFTGQTAPPSAVEVKWPKWDEQKARSVDFIGYLNFLMTFAPPAPSEQALMARFAKIGIGAGRPFNAALLDPAMRSTMEEAVSKAQKDIEDRVAQTTSSTGLFGTREQLGSDYIMRRAIGAAIGIYGNSPEEAIYGAYQAGADQKPLEGARKYVIRFEPGQLPPVNLFWSLTMYNLPQRLLVANPIKRYSIGDRTAGLKTGADGSLEIYLQHDAPGGAKDANWLPTPSGPFFMVLRMYGPKDTLIKGEWKRPLPTPTP